MWFSSGGTKSVLHNDDVDNINCLFHGTKELLFIEYKKYKNQVIKLTSSQCAHYTSWHNVCKLVPWVARV